MTNNGWIKIERKVLDWEWFADSSTFHVFMFCLIRANHKPNKWRGTQLNAGEFITSHDKISAATGLTISQIRTALQKLKKTGEVTVKKTNKFSYISITNWEKYQDVDRQDSTQLAGKLANKSQTNRTEIATDKNVKNDKNEKKERGGFAQPALSDLKKFIKENELNLSAESFINYYESNGWYVGKNKMKNWKASARNWSKRNNAENKDERSGDEKKWQETATGIRGKAKDIGLRESDFDSFPHFKKAVFNQVRQQQNAR